jgi:hypothetical protein
MVNLQMFFSKFFKDCDQYWFGNISAYPITAFRILFGFFLFVYFASFFPHVNLFFSNEGLTVPFLIPDISPSPFIAWFIYLLTLVLILFFMFGFKTRFVTPLLLVFFVYHFALSLAVKNCSYDRLIMLFLFLLSFAELDKAWSIFSTTNSSENPQTKAWVTHLLMVQVALFYFGTGFYKVFTPAWQNGLILKMTLASNWGTPAAFWFLSLHPPMWLFDLLTWSVILFELACGFLFYVRPIQKYVFLVAAAFHTSIWLFLGIPHFMLCVTTYVLFLPPEELKPVGDVMTQFLRKISLKSSTN